MTLLIRPATSDDVRRYYPDVRASFRAWVAELDGVVSGIIGLVLTRPIACLISHFSEELRPHLKRLSILRLIKKVHSVCLEHGGRIIAVQEMTEEQSPIILARLGFEPFGDVDGDQWHIFRG